MRTLFLAWQDPNTRRWFPIGRLTQTDNRFVFVYVHGVTVAQEETGFQLLPSFPVLERVYESGELFPLFANRVMPHSRPDFPNYVEWLRLEDRDKDPLAFLETSGGSKMTDTFEVFPTAARQEDGTYRTLFFIHGLRHMPRVSRERAMQAEPGERLRLLLDPQNRHDPQAVALATCKAASGDLYVIGYCPRYLNPDIYQALQNDVLACQATVVMVNPPPAPVQIQVLCQLDFLPQSRIVPFQGERFQPISQEASL